MHKSIFKIHKMDCPSEENLIRMKLDEVSSIKKLDFDIPNRLLTIFHEGDIKKIEHSIHQLNLKEQKISSEETTEVFFSEDQQQRKLLWAVLVINAAFFLIEMITGLFAKSMGLIADSLDMLADSFVYGISLLVVGKILAKKKKVALVSGYFQITLALIGFIEVLRRFLNVNEAPNFQTMITISSFALIANAFCLYLLQKSKSNEAHIQASMIFTSNDVIINLGVIIAALSVYWTNSNKPDLIIGSIVFLLVIQGAFRILKLGK